MRSHALPDLDRWSTGTARADRNPARTVVRRLDRLGQLAEAAGVPIAPASPPTGGGSDSWAAPLTVAVGLSVVSVGDGVVGVGVGVGPCTETVIVTNVPLTAVVPACGDCASTIPG